MSDKRLPIIAIATAQGRGAISVVRVSGPHLGPFILRLIDRALQPRHAYYLPIIGLDGRVIDQVVAIYFQGPHSFTGEDILELQCHGGVAVTRLLLQHCLTVGQPESLRLAQPGEFTERAFLNDKIDLVQAEAVADLIDASSESAARAAMASLTGGFSNQISELAESILRLRLLVEATLDFPEEEIDFLEKYQARSKLDTIEAQLTNLLKVSKQGLVLREGLSVVLAGAPNAGKSSLLNALADDDVSIVTDIAGTTRDKITHTILINGIPLSITDTAGLRDTEDHIEAIGIERTWKAVQQADVIIHLIDGSNPQPYLDKEIDQRRSRTSVVLSVINKTDLIAPTKGSSESLFISAKTGDGIQLLKDKLLSIAGWQPSSESPWLARQRHTDALLRAMAHLATAKGHAALDDRVLDLFAEELRLAHNQLGSIIGKTSADDLLGEIFSHFCIGK